MYESFDDLVRKHLSCCLPSAKTDRIAPGSGAIVCLAEQNIITFGLKVPPERSQELRQIARAWIGSIR